MNETNILLGTSGWSYKDWEGSFYDKGEKHKLRTYSRIFKTAEIDSTFYKIPTKGMVMGWLRYSPPDFLFSAKLPKTITHDKKLGLKHEVKTDLENYLEIMRSIQLGGKLACLLIQLPPKYDYNPENLEDFFDLLDPLFRYAVEFRNLSWIREETWEILKKHKIAYVNVDEPLLPPEIHITTDFAYFRWHGKGQKIWFDYNYSKSEIDEWIPKIENTKQKVKKMVGYFNNHYHGYAPENCLYLMKQLGLLSKEQKPYRTSSIGQQSRLFDFTTQNQPES